LIPIEYSDPFAEALSSVPESERIRWQRHKIASGETISGIAQKYGITAASIRAANDLSNNTIRAGSYLMIPVASRPLSDYSKSADARREQKQNRRRSGNRIEHVVRAGDSFWAIAKRYDVGTRELAAWNGMAPRDTLSVGQTLVVWSKSATAPSGAARLSGTTRKVHYTVRSGDSLYLIASRFRTTVNNIVRWNNIDKDKILRPGQKLTMYVDVTAQSS
jgi:membrane-bound lytic murein transglycosylase D